MVRLTGNPGGQFDGDHASASHTLYTGYRSGQIGLATVMHKALRDQLGAQFDAQYPLPAVSVGQPAWSFGVGDYAGARPIFLTSPSGLPTTDPGKSVSAWGRKAEGELDAAFQASRQAFMAQSASDFINDKMAGDAHVTQLINPALHLSTPGAAALGTLMDGTTPVTNDMLNEVFGLDNTVTPSGDLLFDCFGALASSTTPTWNSATTNNFGFSGALAVRLLQIGAPLVSVTMGSWDTHSYEVIDPQNKHPRRFRWRCSAACWRRSTSRSRTSPIRRRRHEPLGLHRGVRLLRVRARRQQHRHQWIQFARRTERRRLGSRSIRRLADLRRPRRGRRAAIDRFGKRRLLSSEPRLHHRAQRARHRRRQQCLSALWHVRAHQRP